MGRAKIDFESKEVQSIREILVKSVKSGLGGMTAMFIQVGSLMWMRTIMNYQYRYGANLRTTVRTLYKQGGVTRFYRGVSAAIIQAPLSRFGDTFANTFFLSMMNRYERTRDMPILFKTVGASLTAASYRIMLTPVDTIKTTLQVEGLKALGLLRKKVAENGIRVM